MSQPALDALCDYLGIAPAFEDAWGRRTEVPDVSRLALLKAMGHALDEHDIEASAHAELGRLRAEEAARVLPPQLVLEAGPAPLCLTPRLPADAFDTPLRWRIRLQDGGERSGRTLARALPAEATGDHVPLLAAELNLPVSLPQGDHRLWLYHAGTGQTLVETALVVCPGSAHPAGSERLWGPSVQVYALRSARHWGMGDFGDLRRLVDSAADAGAHFVGVNPLHALFPHDPTRASPYSPSSREWLNVLYIDVEATRDFAECAAALEHVATADFRSRLVALRTHAEVDYAGVAAAKFEVLTLLYHHFRSHHLERGTQRAGLFRDFQREGGRGLRLHALFDALQAHFHTRDAAVWGWPAWPEAYRDPDGEAVQAYARDHEHDIEFFEYLQWLAEAQLRAVASRARARGLRVGLYRDLAVGVNEGGSETWARQSLHAFGAHAGAPPDELNPVGQDWGFPPPIPRRQADDGHAAFRAVLAANMRHAGALRIDHVMSLMRLFWLPARGADGQPMVGAYVASALEPLMRLLCLESRRQRCMVIGEDLGIVPPQVREAMARHGLLSYRPLYFEQQGEAFRAPAQWQAAALAVIGTHDLPTLRGYWRGHDLQLREQLGIYVDTELRDRHVQRRQDDRVALLRALAAEGLAGELTPDEAAPGGEAPAWLSAAVHRFIARTPAVLVAVQLEDVLGQLEAVNLPGTDEQMQPNWRRRLDVSLSALPAAPRWQAVVEALRSERHCPPLALSGGPADFRPERAVVPRATYRLQLHRDFGFADARAVLPYLAALGISHVYASPFLKARPGSTHGYDIVDHATVNPEIGSEEDFDLYCACLAELGMSQVIDIVPNHVGVLGAENAWWLDVLANGPASEYAAHFDIDWSPPSAELQGKLLLPVLGDQYGQVLENGELRLGFAPQHGEFSVHYYEHRFPVDLSDYPALLSMADAADNPAAFDEANAALEILLAALRHLPPRDADDPEAVAERRRNQPLFRQQLADLHARLPAVRARVAAALEAHRGQAGDPASFDALDDLLSRQAYRLASWRVAADDINYRRFFDVNDLAALRMEHAPVFEATHERILQWVAEGRASGLRIDHPDGLADPAGYFERLQTRHAEVAGPDAQPLYVVVEKIFAEFEPAPDDWRVHGDTGYRFANLCNNLFVDPVQEARFSRIYRAFTGEARDFSEVLLEARQLIMTHSLSGELGTLSHWLHDIAQRDRRTRDFTRSRLRGALAEIIAAFPVYRSYISARGLGDADRRYVERAVEDAARRGLAGDASVLRFVRDVLLGAPTEPDADLRARKLAFLQRLQQFTAPVMAKAMEDTAFYRYTRLVSLNEVGGDPRTFGIGVEDFHLACERLACTHPYGMLGTSTHDSKRSEDVRARIDVLSEMPGAWRLALRRWRGLNVRHKTRLSDATAPSANDEYLFYQTLLGVWPFEAPGADERATLLERLQACMQKSAREAKTHTSWMNPDAAYEAALAAFIRRVLADEAGFMADFVPFQQHVAQFGAFNSLNTQLLKLAVPGVPDIYQGCEGWNFSLVDPDNRRPVDFDAAAQRLRTMQHDYPQGANAEGLDAMLATLPDSRLKQYLLWRGLSLRQRMPATLRDGPYLPLDVQGPAARHVVAFARVGDDGAVVVIATRLLMSLCAGDAARVADAAVWAGTSVALPWQHAPDGWSEMLSGRGLARADDASATVELSEVFGPLPMALLVAERGQGDQWPPAA